MSITRWSLTNQEIGNREVIVDTRLTTITPENPTGFVKLNPESNDPIVREIEYAIQTDGKVTYRVPQNLQDKLTLGDPGPSVSGFRQFNNIQEIADAGYTGYESSTTLKIKDSLTSQFREQTQNKIIRGEGISPFSTQQNSPSDLEGGSTPDEVNRALGVFAGIKGKGNMDLGDGYSQYPFKIKNMDTIFFKAYEYGVKKFRTDRIGFESGRDFTTSKGSVVIGIQPSLRDRNTVNWGGRPFGMDKLAGLQFFSSLVEGGTEEGDKFVNAAINTLGIEDQSLKNAVMALIGGAAVGVNPSDLLSRLTGTVFNPNIELLFNGPELRTFNFNFKMSPRNREEGTNVKKIINFFKRNMAVQRTEAELFLKAPNVFDIQYRFNNQDIHPSLNKIKKCALTDFSVNYTPQNSYMTFDDGVGTMVSYEISMTMQELEPIYMDDYDESPTTEIGY